ncbi:MAG: hypothetical protein RL097_367 [Candidatus Parcubacteria bacterium]
MSLHISNIVKIPQQVIDSIGMYRIVSGSLGILVASSVIAGFTGSLAYSAASQIVALFSALVLALVLNSIIARTLQIHANHESAVITALILFFLFIPAEQFLDNNSLWLAVAIAIVSKFVLVYQKQHLLNAAAVGAFAISFTNFYPATWWVGNPTLFLPLVILGVAIVMKVRRWVPVLSFIGVGLLVYLFEAWQYGDEPVQAVNTFFLSWPTLFLAFFMLTEPFTMPSTARVQGWYGAVVGFLAHTTLFSPLIGMTPELALLIGNVLFYPFRLRKKLFLTLESRGQIATDTYESVFTKPTMVSFQAGQYLEWMLPHTSADGRGVRRYFTIASSPTEQKIRIAYRAKVGGSTYKQALLNMKVGDELIASQLGGDFTLPSSANIKLGFIAGGIGITPFRSHIQYMVDTKKSHDTVLLYCCTTVAELAYEKEFEIAKETLPLRVIPVIASGNIAAPAESGYITRALLERRVPDFLERTWYLSGPPAMVDSYYNLLRKAGVSGRHIKRDFFSGAI